MSEETTDGPDPYVLFDQFMVCNTMKDILSIFHKLKKRLRLDPSLKHLQLYSALKEKLTTWKCRSIWNELDKRASQKPYEGGEAAKDLSVVVIGGGPCGLRMAIECVLLGCDVVVIEKRETFSRNNVLHLWPFTIEDLKKLGAKKFYGKFCAGTLDHISIRILQCMLLKICLLLGVTFYCPVEYLDLVEPEEEAGWRIKVAPDNHPLGKKDIDVVIGADGRKSTLPGFDRKEFRGTLALAITANFVNYFTQEEASVEEIAGVARIFNQKFFKELKDELSIDLENIVYYKDETHYFVMTAKKDSLRLKGVLKEDFSDARQLLHPSNIDKDNLYQYAYEAAEWSTELPRLDFASGKIPNVPDVALFDFTSMHAAEHSCRIVPKNGKELLLLLVGDSLLEPFWPMGTGLARGFLSVFDGAWMMRRFAKGHDRLSIIAERECTYRFLAQSTPDSLLPKMADYTIEPESRYNKVKLCPRPGSEFKFLYHSNVSRKRSVKIKRQSRDFTEGTEETSLQKKFKEIRARTETPMDNGRQDLKEETVMELEEEAESKTTPVTSPEELLKWFSEEVKEYGLEVKDFQRSFSNGMVLCALMHRYFPQEINYTSHKPFTMLKNSGKAMSLAEKHLGIARMLKPAEMAHPDRLALLAYLTQFYEVLQDKEPVGTPPPPTEIRRQKFSTPELRSPSPVLGRLPSPSPSSSPSSDVPRRIPKQNKVPVSQRFSVASSDVCFFCEKKVYLMERQSAEGVFFHRPCFRCSHCKCQLQVGNYAYSRGQGGEPGKFFCRPHFRQLFMSNPEAINYARAGAGGPRQSSPKKEEEPMETGPSKPTKVEAVSGAEKKKNTVEEKQIEDEKKAEDFKQDDEVLPSGEGSMNLPKQSTPIRAMEPIGESLELSLDDNRRTQAKLEESFEIKMATRPAKVVNIAQRSMDYGMDSLIPEMTGEMEETKGDEPQAEAPPTSTTPIWITKSPQTSLNMISPAHRTMMSPSVSVTSQYGTPGEGSLASFSRTLRSRTRGQKHLYRSVKVPYEVRLLSEMERVEKKKQMNRFREAQDIQRQMSILEQQHDDLAAVGGRVEEALRNAKGEEEPRLMLKWLEIVHERNVLIRNTNDFANRMRDLEVEDQLYEVEHQLQELAVSEMTEADMEQYEKLLKEKLAIIDLRDNFVDLADNEKRREEEEDIDQSRMMETVFGVRDQNSSEGERRRSASVIPVGDEKEMEKARKKKQRWSLLGFGKKHKK
jgi:hypothetical protein